MINSLKGGNEILETERDQAPPPPFIIWRGLCALCTGKNIAFLPVVTQNKTDKNFSLFFGPEKKRRKKPREAKKKMKPRRGPLYHIYIYLI
jgi:hypothetical protein